VRYAIIVVGLLIILASLDVMRLMDKGDRVLRVSKYVCAALVGFMLSYYATRGVAATGWHLFCGLTLFLFVGSDVLNRFFYELERTNPRLHDLMQEYLHIRPRRRNDNAGH
jgi:uncharacterized membrane protein